MRTMMRTALAPLMVLTLMGCDRLLGSVDDGVVERELATARALWSTRAPDSYAYTISLAAPGISALASQYPVRVTVDNGTSTLEWVENDDNPPPATPVPAGFGEFDTVEELFDVIEESLARQSVQIGAGYDPTWGYPRAFDVVFTNNDRIVFFVSAFEDLD